MAQAGLEITNPATGEVLRLVETVEGGSNRLLIEGDSVPGMIGPPVHLHPGSDEHFEGVEGVVMLEVGGRTRELAAGDSVMIPAGAPHRFFGHPDRPGRFQVSFSSPGGMEDFLVTMFELARSGRTNDKGVPSLTQLAVTISHFPETRVPRPPWAVQRAVFAVLRPVARRRGLKAAYAWGELG